MNYLLNFGLAALLMLGAGCRKKDAAGAFAAPPAQVVSAEARRQTISEKLSLVGTLLANESVEIKSETDGVIQEIAFDEGQSVEKGALLLRLDETKFQANASEAASVHKLNEANLERSRQLSRDKLISQQDFDQVSATFESSKATVALRQRELKDARVYAPFKGIAAARNVSPGQVISKNTTLTWLIDLDPVKLELNIPERFVSQLKIGQKLEFTVATHSAKKFLGEVYFIGPQVDVEFRTALVKARVPNPGLALKPGMFANVELILNSKHDAVVIPEAAVLINADKATVMVVDREQTAQVRPVTLGIRLAGEVEVVSGLQPGERVIIEGLQKVRPGGKVVFAPTPTNEPPAAAKL